MNHFNRENSALIPRVFRALISLSKLFQNLGLGKITFKQFILDLEFRFMPQSKMLNDDFDWEKYPNYYKEELKSVSREHTLLISNKNFEYANRSLIKRDSSAKDLHPNHDVLYRAVLCLSPNSVLEVGCGGGDHLANINQLDPTIQIFGVDRSHAQLNTFKERHFGLSSVATVADITEKEANIEKVDLVFTQAVLMHISEKDSRFQIALRNIFFAAQNFVVLVENWSQHDFLSEIKNIQEVNPDWSKSSVYFMKHVNNSFSSALIVSKNEIKDLEKLVSYDQLLSGRPILVH